MLNSTGIFRISNVLDDAADPSGFCPEKKQRRLVSIRIHWSRTGPFPSSVIESIIILLVVVMTMIIIIIVIVIRCIIIRIIVRYLFMTMVMWSTVIGIGSWIAMPFRMCWHRSYKNRRSSIVRDDRVKILPGSFGRILGSNGNGSALVTTVTKVR